MFQGKPIIAVTASYEASLNGWLVWPNYLQCIRDCGGIPLVMPMFADEAMADYFIQSCDGILFTGGPDVSPWVYGETDSGLCGEMYEPRDRWEVLLMGKAVAADKPMLCVCRGNQLLNAVFGGTLWQDLPTQQPSGLCHAMAAPYDRCAHTVSLVPGSPLAKLLDTQVCQVNSRHHQAIRKLSSRLEIMATAEDGTVEAVWMPDRKFVWGVQWHPEGWFQDAPQNQAIFQAFLRAASEHG